MRCEGNVTVLATGPGLARVRRVAGSAGRGRPRQEAAGGDGMEEEERARWLI